MAHYILLGEDDEAIVEVVSIILEQKGYTYTAATNADEVFAALEQKRPDLMLLDISLSGSTGTEITKKLKADPKTASIPIILMSANSETKALAKESGANGFLAKPFDIEDLLETVRTYQAQP